MRRTSSAPLLVSSYRQWTPPTCPWLQCYSRPVALRTTGVAKHQAVGRKLSISGGVLQTPQDTPGAGCCAWSDFPWSDFDPTYWVRRAVLSTVDSQHGILLIFPQVVCYPNPPPLHPPLHLPGSDYTERN